MERAAGASCLLSRNDCMHALHLTPCFPTSSNYESVTIQPSGRLASRRQQWLWTVVLPPTPAADCNAPSAYQPSVYCRTRHQQPACHFYICWVHVGFLRRSSYSKLTLLAAGWQQVRFALGRDWEGRNTAGDERTGGEERLPGQTPSVEVPKGGG